MLTLNDIDVSGRRVLCREDFNVPVEGDVITDDTRLKRALPTIQYLRDHHAAVILLSHRGRPTPGVFESQYSLDIVARALSQMIGTAVRFEQDLFSGFDVSPGEVVLCENVRFQVGEKENDVELSRRLANLCDVFVMDAFATAHRAQASTAGVAAFAKTAVAGPLLLEELSALDQALRNPQKPLVAIVGGSKVSTKIQLLEKLLDLVDVLIVGGGIANTLLVASGVDVGNSLYESDWIQKAKALLEMAEAKGVKLPLPVDARVAESFSKEASASVCGLHEVSEKAMILDIGPETEKRYGDLLREAGTVLWNGPVGVFEFPAFAHGTHAMVQAIVASNAYSIAGGGDTLAALSQFALFDKISYCSTGGGAFLEYVQGIPLPGLQGLRSS